MILHPSCSVQSFGKYLLDHAIFGISILKNTGEQVGLVLLNVRIRHLPVFGFFNISVGYVVFDHSCYSTSINTLY